MIQDLPGLELKTLIARVRSADEAIGGKLLADIRHSTDIQTAKLIVNLKAATQDLCSKVAAEVERLQDEIKELDGKLGEAWGRQ